MICGVATKFGHWKGVIARRISEAISPSDYNATNGQRTRNRIGDNYFSQLQCWLSSQSPLREFSCFAALDLAKIVSRATHHSFIRGSLILIVGLEATIGLAQDSTNDLESVKRQLQEIHNTINQLENKHQEELQSLKKKLEDQQMLLNQLQNRESSSLTTATNNIESATTSTQPVLPAPAAPWRPTDPIRIAGGGKNYLNISFDGLFAAAASTAPDLQNIETGGHDAIQRGFTVQNLELTFDGAVDPYFVGQANLVTQINRAGNTTFEAEEAWLQTTSLTANLQAKGGLYLSPFGRLNQMHPHAWDFADQPLVNGRFLGADGLRNPGVQLSYLTPLLWYSELLLSIQNGSGGTATSFRNRGDGNVFFGRPTLDREVRGAQDLLYVPRWANSFDLTDEQTLVLGTSAALGPNDTGGTSSTQIYGMDTFYKWKPSNASGGWPFVKWQTEAMYRRFEAGEVGVDTDGDGVNDSVNPPREFFDDWGVYSQVTWGFSKGWVFGLRGDFLNQEKSPFTADATRDNRWRLSPNLTWYPTEFSKIRHLANAASSRFFTLLI